jgi:hypothetical protein
MTFVEPERFDADCALGPVRLRAGLSRRCALFAGMALTQGRVQVWDEPIVGGFLIDFLNALNITVFVNFLK